MDNLRPARETHASKESSDDCVEMPFIETISVGVLLAWGAGINGYATLLLLGLLHNFGMAQLPTALAGLGEPLILKAVATLYAFQFLADKIPGVDSVWDAIHTLVRIPLGALLGVWMVAPAEPTIQSLAGIFGALAATASHAAKSGARLVCNLPSIGFYSHWLRSLLGDGVVALTVLVAVKQQSLAPLTLVFALVATAWALIRVWTVARPYLLSSIEGGGKRLRSGHCRRFRRSRS